MGLMEDQVPWALRSIRFHGPYGASGSMGLLEDSSSMAPMQGFGALGPIWGGALGALGPIWGGASGRPKADIMEAEGRLNGGLGAEPSGIKKSIYFC